jgi:hypothetical protein
MRDIQVVCDQCDQLHTKGGIIRRQGLTVGQLHSTRSVVGCTKSSSSPTLSIASFQGSLVLISQILWIAGSHHRGASAFLRTPVWQDQPSVPAYDAQRERNAVRVRCTFLCYQNIAKQCQHSRLPSVPNHTQYLPSYSNLVVDLKQF